jgi:chaperonin GroES
MKIQPLHDNVIVSPNAAATQTAGGLYIPDNAAEKVTQGKVLAVGPGRTLDNGTVKALAVRVGDEVLYGKYTGTELELGGEKTLVLCESDILGIVKS